MVQQHPDDLTMEWADAEAHRQGLLRPQPEHARQDAGRAVLAAPVAAGRCLGARHVGGAGARLSDRLRHRHRAGAPRAGGRPLGGHPRRQAGPPRADRNGLRIATWGAAATHRRGAACCARVSSTPVRLMEARSAWGSRPRLPYPAVAESPQETAGSRGADRLCAAVGACAKCRRAGAAGCARVWYAGALMEARSAWAAFGCPSGAAGSRGADRCCAAVGACAECARAGAAGCAPTSPASWCP